MCRRHCSHSHFGSSAANNSTPLLNLSHCFLFLFFFSLFVWDSSTTRSRSRYPSSTRYNSLASSSNRLQSLAPSPSRSTSMARSQAYSCCSPSTCGTGDVQLHSRVRVPAPSQPSSSGAGLAVMESHSALDAVPAARSSWVVLPQAASFFGSFSYPFSFLFTCVGRSSIQFTELLLQPCTL